MNRGGFQQRMINLTRTLEKKQASNVNRPNHFLLKRDYNLSNDYLSDYFFLFYFVKIEFDRMTYRFKILHFFSDLLPYCWIATRTPWTLFAIDCYESWLMIIAWWQHTLKYWTDKRAMWTSWALFAIDCY